MASNLEQCCEGCGQPGYLSHSHLISQSICWRKKVQHLIPKRENVRYHCINGGNLGKPCHEIWEGNDPALREKMFDYEENKEFVITQLGEQFWANNFEDNDE
tara:strand:- start:11123 stop:11428 length:306 start_codon:yes stop_codon:yes gene_type:complete